MLDSEKSWLAGALEAMLFVTDEPVTVLTLLTCWSRASNHSGNT